MTYLLLQTFLLLLAAYFAGAFTACLIRRATMARAAVETVPVPVREPTVMATPAYADLSHREGFEHLEPRPFERVQPRIDILQRPEPRPTPAIADIARFDRALSGPDPNEGMPRISVVEVRPAVFEFVTGPALPWPPPRPPEPEPEPEPIVAPAPPPPPPVPEVRSQPTDVDATRQPAPPVYAGYAAAHAAAAAAAATAAHSSAARAADEDTSDDDVEVVEETIVEDEPAPLVEAANVARDDDEEDADSDHDDADEHDDDDDADEHDDDEAASRHDDEAARADDRYDDDVDEDDDDDDHYRRGTDDDDDDVAFDDEESDDDAGNVTQSAVVPTVEAAPAEPAALITTGDDLQRIRAIDADMEQRLKTNGVMRFIDVAKWTPDEIELIDVSLDLDGRIDREQWVEQAQILAKGGETYYSRNRAAAVRATSAMTPQGGAGASAEASSAGGPTGPEFPSAPTLEGGFGTSGKTVAELAAAAAAAIAAASASVTRGIKPIEPISPLSKVNPNIAIPARITDAIKAREQTAPNEPPPEQQPAPSAAPSGDGDDLKRIRGVGVLIAKRLNALGITHYEQIANWSNADVDRISKQMEFGNRIEREGWIQQARILASGGQTEFSRRFDRGESD